MVSHRKKFGSIKRRKNSKKTHKLNGGGSFTNDNSIINNIISNIKFYDLLYNKYNDIKKDIIQKWTTQTKENQFNSDKLSLLMNERDYDILFFIENLLSDLEKKEHKDNIKLIISSQISNLLFKDNDRSKAEITILTSKYNNLVKYLNDIKKETQPKQKPSRNEMESHAYNYRQTALDKEKKSRNSKKNSNQMNSNSRMARELDMEYKRELHTENMKNPRYKRKFDDEIKILQDQIEKYIEIEKMPNSVKFTDKKELLNYHIDNWYLYDDKKKQSVLNNINFL